MEETNQNATHPVFSKTEPHTSDDRYYESRDLPRSLTNIGLEIKELIVNQNRHFFRENPHLRDLFGLYLRLKEYEGTDFNPGDKLRKEWVSLVSRSCELILKEAPHPRKSAKARQKAFSTLRKKFQTLKEDGPEEIFERLASEIAIELSQNGVRFSDERIEREIRDYYDRNSDIEEEIKMNINLPWIDQSA